MNGLFNTIIDSTRVRAFKPDPAIYQAALKALGPAAGTNRDGR